MKEFRTVRLLHQEINYQSQGFKGQKGDLLCRMGRTGTNLIHSHIDMGVGGHRQMSLALLNNGGIKPDKELLYLFVNAHLFRIEPHISIHFLDPSYEITEGRKHPALDVVPINRKETTANYDMYWPLDCDFEVIDAGTYNDGTKYMIIWFEVGKDDEEMYESKLKLENDWQWDMLYDTFESLENKGYLNSSEWRQKAMDRTLTRDEIAWLNIILLDRTSKSQGSV